MPQCSVDAPQLQQIAPGRTVSCHLYDKDKTLTGSSQAISTEQAPLRFPTRFRASLNGQ
tara:strand:- start:321 stop:497 length:177 start_codon:yes stop_codon:yes gene_type:complete